MTIAGDARVSEEALPGGIPGPNAPVPPVAQFTGTLTISDPEGGPFTLQAALPTQTFTSGGVAVVWTASADGSSLVGRAGTTDVATLTLSPSTSQYQFTLLQPIDHIGGNGAPVDSLAYSFQLTARDPDGLTSTPQTLTVQIADDTPGQAQPLAFTAPVTNVDTNVMVILDVSGSMGQSAGHRAAAIHPAAGGHPVDQQAARSLRRTR